MRWAAMRDRLAIPGQPQGLPGIDNYQQEWELKGVSKGSNDVVGIKAAHCYI